MGNKHPRYDDDFHDWFVREKKSDINMAWPVADLMQDAYRAAKPKSAQPSAINKAALHQAQAARKKYRQDTPISLQSIEGEDAVFVAAYSEATESVPAAQPSAEVVERVARAIAVADGVTDPDALWDGYPWWVHYKEQAIAALQAVKGA